MSYLGPNSYEIFGADNNIREQENSDIQYIVQLSDTKICNGGRICYILINFPLNISALNSENLIVIEY